MHIRLEMNSIEDVKKINEFASKCDFNVYVSTTTGHIDAKSILGLTTLIGKDNLNLVFPDHVRFERVEKAMKKANLL